MNRQEFAKYVQQGGKLFVAARAIEKEGRWLIKRGETVELRADDGTVNPSFYFPNREDRDRRAPMLYCNWDYLFLSDLEPQDTLASPHYDTLHQPIETMQANMTPEEFQGYVKGNIIKYVCRMGRKAGEDKLKEAKKIRNYAKWLVESLEGKTIKPREDEQ